MFLPLLIAPPHAATTGAVQRVRRPGPTFAQVLAETEIREAGALAWSRMDALPDRAEAQETLADGSRVAVWRGPGAWLAACERPGAGGPTVVALFERPSIELAAQIASLAAIVTGPGDGSLGRP